jgi:hypothetical protein
MQLPRANLIVSALGCLTLIASVSACSPAREPLQIQTKPVDMPELVLPAADTVKTRPFEWIIITEANYEKVFSDLRSNGQQVVLFGVTDQGYENLALNINDLRTFIQQQNSIILAYKNYYIRSQSVMENSVVLQ